VTDRGADFRRLYKDLRITEQRGYYEQRSHEYDRAHRQSIMVRNTLLVLAAAAGVTGQFFEGTGRTTAGIVAAACAALATAVTAYESLMGFGSLAKLYDDVALSLREAELQWAAEPPPDAADADPAAAVEQVEQVFSSENGQWGQLTIQSKPAADSESH
jgi:hypothetical protein